MLPNEETNFPRGRKPVEQRNSTKRKNKNDSLFGPQKQKKQKRIEKLNVSSHSQNSHVATQRKTQILSRATLHEGMILLACIRNITDHALEVELPGLLSAKVKINAISANLNVRLKNALQSSEISSVKNLLKTVFTIGQYVPFKMAHFEDTEEKSMICGSISPTEIYNGRRHNSFKRGELLWAEVVSELDHGFQLDCGVSNCRIFLPNENNDKELKIGQLIWCKIYKVDAEAAASTLRVGVKNHHVDSVLTDESVPLNLIMPGSKVEIHIEEIKKDGVYCRFLNNYVGFVHESHLTVNKRKLAVGKKTQAYVLYVEDTTRITYLSFRGLQVKREPSYSRGDKLSAVIVGSNSRGLYLKLTETAERGWVSNRRLLNALGPNSLQSIKEKFAIGSKHRCVVLSYFHIDRTYVCGIENDLIKEKYFKVSDFRVGESIEGTIDEIKSNGIVLKVGQVKGFVNNIHLTDSKFSEYLKKKFVLGRKLKARVFSVHEETVTFTLKTKFIKDEKCLSSIEDARVDEIYPALILSAKPFGLILSFYNNIEGFVHLNELNLVNNVQEYRNNPSLFFYSGEVVNVRILKRNTWKITASLVLTKPKNNVKLNDVGTIVTAIVRDINETGLNVFVPTQNVDGFVPLEHLSIDLSLCSPMLSTYKIDDEIRDLMIVKAERSRAILSRREALAYERCGLKVPKFEEIRTNDVIRCSIESITDGGSFVSTPIKSMAKNVFFVESKWISSNGISHLTPKQSVLAKVMEVDQVKKIIKLSLRLEDVFVNDLKMALNFFASFMADEAHIKEFGKANGSILCEYEIGENVPCVVKNVESCGCHVELPNGAPGLVANNLIGLPHPKKGDKLRGLILGRNFRFNYLEICLDKRIGKRLNFENQNSNNIDELTIETLLVKEEYILAHSRHRDYKRLVYLPLRTCENDIDKSLLRFYKNDAFKIRVAGYFDGNIVGFHRKMKFLKDKKTKKNSLERNNTTTAEIDNDESTDIEIIEEASEENCKKSQENNKIEPEEDGKADETEPEVEEDNEATSEENDKIENEREREKTQEIKRPVPVLPSIANFFDYENVNKAESSTSSDEETEINCATNQKTKLTAAEKKEREKLTEEKISKIEAALVDSAHQPENVQDFERRLLAEPNSSVLWIKFIAFYLATAEFDKARAVAKKALETINITYENEKFNVWISLLNLENLYGTRESFEETLKEALKYNDAFKIYSNVIDMLYESGKLLELEEKINRIRTKYKQVPEMWTHIGKIYYLLGKFDEARDVKNASLKSITNMKQQFDLIIKFALLEFAHGDIDFGVSIFENILETYPNKAKSWSIYINQLVRKGLISDARNLFQRAITSHLPLKVTKRIHIDYKNFEEKYGTPETLELFKRKANETLLSIKENV